MKLRSLILPCALAAASATFGDIVAANSCGIMVVPTSQTTTLVSVPWKDVKGSGDTVKVADLVMTAGLKKDSKLYYYDGAAYKCWNLSADGGTWTPMATTLSINGESHTLTAPSADFGIARGSALWLERVAGSDAVAYLYGEKGVALSSTPKPNAVSMIANTSVTDKSLEGLTGAANGDSIIIPGDNGSATVYLFNGTEWGSYVKTTTQKTIGSKTFDVSSTTWTTGGTIPGGKAAWYQSTGSTVPTFTW